ncbi:glycyl-radical enzyme activating protein [Chloroflexota bacterium]
MTKGIVFNIQRFSVEDGPGIRTTVFLKGCPLKCPWCSNPESQNTFPEVVHRDSLCNQCGRCVEVCELNAISLNEKAVSIDRALCNNCARCVEVCLPGALTVYGKEVFVDEVLDEIRKDMIYYRNSGGGVTASGGEPLVQVDFVAALFQRCQAAGIHTTLDTCGYASKDALDKVLEHTDLVLFDLKILDQETHDRVLKTSQEPVLRNLNMLVEKGSNLLIRIPLIPTFIDTEENLKAIAELISRLNRDIKIEVLPYHRYGTGKYQMLDRSYEPDGLTTQTEEQLNAIKGLFHSFGVDCL